MTAREQAFPQRTSAVLIFAGLILASALGVVLAGCDISSPIDDSGRPLAWVGRQKLTSADLRITGPTKEVDQRRDAIDRGIDDLLVEQEARRRGLGYTEQAVRRIVAVRRAAIVRERKILRDVLYEVVASEVEVGEDELRREFDLLSSSNKRRRVTLKVQIFESRESAEEAHEALAVASKVVGPALIRELPAGLRKAVKSLETIGDRVVVQSGLGWLNVELAAGEIVAASTFERAREPLERRLRRRKADEAFERELERLRAAAEIRLEPGVLESDVLWPTIGPTSVTPTPQPF